MVQYVFTCRIVHVCTWYLYIPPSLPPPSCLLFPLPLQDAIPMVQQMKYNPMFQPAMMQVFGKTLICRDIDKASYFAKNTNHDCITLDGMLDNLNTQCSASMYNVQHMYMYIACSLRLIWLTSFALAYVEVHVLHGHVTICLSF